MIQQEQKLIFVEHSTELLPGVLQSPSIVIANAARVSRKGDLIANVDECRSLVKRLMIMGHWSPFEFYDLCFSVVTTRAVSHELVRHRLMSIVQQSQRYCRYDNGLQVIMPATVKDTLEDALWREHVSDAYDTYLFLLEKGHKPEDARTVLPTATATNMIAKMNLREFRHFLNLRTDKAAWVEMRLLANRMARAFAKRYPDEVYLIEDVWKERGL